MSSLILVAVSAAGLLSDNPTDIHVFINYEPEVDGVECGIYLEPLRARLEADWEGTSEVRVNPTAPVNELFPVYHVSVGRFGDFGDNWNTNECHYYTQAVWVTLNDLGEIVLSLIESPSVTITDPNGNPYQGVANYIRARTGGMAFNSD